MDVVTAMATAIAGGLVVPLLQVVKRYMGIRGTPFAWVAYGVSWIVGAFILLVTGKMEVGQFMDPGQLFVEGSAIWGVAYLIYRSVIKKTEQGGGQ